MSTPQEERASSPALLLMISDGAGHEASARSSHRQARRWTPDAEAKDAGSFAGDPTRPETYAWITDARAVTAVVHVKDDERAEAVVRALRSVRPDSAMLVLSEAVDAAPGDGTLTRAGELRDVLRLDLEDELLRLEAERRAWCLKRFVDGTDVVPILLHPDPDPDALSSAMGIRSLLRRDAHNAPILSARAPTRPENQRMARLLDLSIVEMPIEELGQYRRIIVVDMQPPASAPREIDFAVIDHHPAEESYAPAFLDLRPEIGATATMITEYLRTRDPEDMDAHIATALLHGIRTDTDQLTRGVSAADVEAYAFLQKRIDPSLLRNIAEPAVKLEAAHIFGNAIASMVVHDGCAYAYAGSLDEDDVHILADIADYCLTVDCADHAAVAGKSGDRLIITLRATEEAEDAGEIAQVLAGNGGTGGGHATMARASCPIDCVTEWNEGEELDSLIALVERARGKSRRSASARDRESHAPMR